MARPQGTRQVGWRRLPRVDPTLTPSQLQGAGARALGQRPACKETGTRVSSQVKYGANVRRTLPHPPSLPLSVCVCAHVCEICNSNMPSLAKEPKSNISEVKVRPLLSVSLELTFRQDISTSGEETRMGPRAAGVC